MKAQAQGRTSFLSRTREIVEQGRPERLGIAYARLALGAAFLSAVADRFGLWGPFGKHNVSWGTFHNFTVYVGMVNSFLPSSWAQVLAWMATAAELSLGIALVIGLWPKWVAAGSAVLLAIFGLAMAISFGIKSPLDFSVFSASAGALILALYQHKGNKRAAERSTK